MNTEMVLLNILFYLACTVISVWFYLSVLRARYVKTKTAVFMTLTIFISYLPTFLPIYKASETAEIMIDGIQILWELAMICWFTTATMISKIMAYLGVNISMVFGMLAAQSWRDKKFAYAVALIAAFGCLNVIVQWYKKRKKEEPLKHVHAIIFSQVALLLVMYAVGMAVVRIKSDIMGVVLMSLIVLLFFLIVLLQHSVYHTARREYADERKRMQEKEVRDVLSVYKDVQQQEKELQGLSQKLEQIFLQRDYENNTNERICENETLNYILRDKQLLAQQKNCDMHIRIQAEPVLSWDSMDLVSLMTNALDNAIEATARVNNRKRKILVEGQMSGECFRLVISNPYEGQLMLEEGKLKTTKEDVGNHGYGTLQIKRIAEKYGRTLSIHTENQQFTVEIT